MPKKFISDPQIPESAPTTPQSKESPVDSIFPNSRAQINVEAEPNSITDLLDETRDEISKESKWTLEIYEIGKSARELRK